MSNDTNVASIMLEDEATTSSHRAYQPSVTTAVPRVKQQAPETLWQERVQMLYEEGASDIEICKELRFRPSTFDQNYTNNPAFRDLIDIGRIVAQSWWMEQGRKNVHNTKFNTTLYALIMKNRFGWAEKVESNGLTLSKDESLDALTSKAKAVLPDLLKRLHPEMGDSELMRMLSKDVSR